MTRCDLCPAKHQCLEPDGPEDSPYLFVGEAPGFNEDKAKAPFVGKSGREVNEHYLPIAGLQRRGTRFDNAIRCLPDRPQGRLSLDRRQDRELLECCAAHHLYDQLNQGQHKLIVPMGALACHVIDPDINLDLQHGIPLETSWGTVFPMYHPAGGLHEPKKMLLIRNDWVRLGKYLKGKLSIPQDHHPRPDYREINGYRLLGDYLECNDYSGVIAIDTEITRFREPFCLTLSTSPGSGRLIRAADKDSLEIFQLILDQWNGPILLHNYMFDAPVLRRMGIRPPERYVVDTMVRAYHLGNLPQGLKALAYRLLGMQMQDFTDLVLPYSQPVMLDYLNQAAALDWPKPDEDLVRTDEGGWKLYQAQGMNTKLKRFFTDLGKNPNIDLLERWDNWEDNHRVIEEKLGPWPGMCITHVPMDKIVHYACRDTDATLRLWPVLEQMRRDVRKKLPEHWGG